MAKVLIAMSGGVDSSVAAYLMKEKGMTCVGATMQLLDGHDKNIADAKAICDKLCIPFYAFDMREEFKAEVIGDFVDTFEKGETPNPCVLCNKRFKFGALLEKADELGCDYIVTGHYAKITSDENGFYLEKAENKAKDQSYFLYSVSPDVLSRVMFPLADYSKDEIRQIAEDLGFETAQKKDSQDICFVPNGDYAKVICDITGKTYKSGNFVDLNGKKLGTHRGIIHYTVGQRKGLGVAFGKPMYVHSKRIETNEVALCDDAELFTDTLTARNVNWLCLPKGSTFDCKARIRYRHEEQPATVTITNEGVIVKFETPQRAVTPGQSVVFYEGDRVLGGGIIN
jgi:tRNA-specific 2-thiouridylase